MPGQLKGTIRTGRLGTTMTTGVVKHTLGTYDSSGNFIYATEDGNDALFVFDQTRTTADIANGLTLVNVIDLNTSVILSLLVEDNATVVATNKLAVGGLGTVKPLVHGVTNMTQYMIGIAEVGAAENCLCSAAILRGIN